MLVASEVGLFSDTKFWVGAAFVIFVLLLVLKGVPVLAAKALDNRADAIRLELEKARRLREDAENLLSDYQRKSKEVEAESTKIIEKAQSVAETIQTEMHHKLQATLVRRKKQIEDKISRAEKQAVNDVRDLAVDKAIAASIHLFKGKLTADCAKKLVDKDITNLRDVI
ncbi:MAG: ATP synthase subunit b [Hyphomicrobiaceae bacterium hypho_1]